MLKSYSKGKNLTDGPIAKTLFALAAPVIFGMALQTAYNIVDTYFIGLLGSDELAAISVTFPVVFIFIAIASGLSVGTIALASQAIGAKNRKRASNVAEHSLLLAIIAGIGVASFGILFSPYIFSFMGARDHILAMTIQYANLIFVGFIFLFIGFISQGIIQAGGDTKTPTFYLLISVTLNIILDPVMIFGLGPIPAMGLFGAALATVISRGVGAALNIFHLFSGKALITIDISSFTFNKSILWKIITVGWPSSLSNSINSIGLIALMSLVGLFGTKALAAFGVGIRLESLAILPVIGLSTALTPFVGQNLGAKIDKRVRKAVLFASLAAAVFMGIFSLIWFFLPQFLYMPFTNDATVAEIGARYLQIISFGYIFLGIAFVMNGLFQGSGHTRLQLAVNATRWIAVVGSALILMKMFGIDGIWAGFPIGNFASFFVALALYKWGKWNR
ncbi:MAG: MATE family efflux transporter [Candidatus Micrarchaeota archaeon]|nr:MATE family efflux transporter [Candidatus Micrarchaeota archaeon]